MAEKDSFQLEEYIEIVLYRKWLLIAPIVVLVLLTGIGSQFLSNIYRGETLILVEPQKIPEEFVKSTVSVDLENRITTLRDQILSRTRLEKIIREFDLYSDLTTVLPMEEVVDIMRGNIRIEVQNRESFRIYFMGQDPYTVMNVTNRLAGTFIRESLQDRERQAINTLSFLDTELTRVKKKLEEQEEKIRSFKQRHLGQLPEQQDANQRRLDRLQDQLQTISAELAEAENRKVILQSALAELSSSSISSEGSGGDVVSLDTQIERLRAQLADLRLKYTDAHPDVKRVKGELADLEAKRSSESSSSGGRITVTSRNRGLVRELDQVNLDIDTMRSERARTRAEIRDFQKRVESAPRIEAELQILTRDYEKTKENHDDLLKKRQEAERAASLELKQKGEQFKIVDPARLPQTPYKPKRAQLVLFAFILGTAIGFGSIFLAEHFDNSFRGAQDVEDECGIAVLTTVPRFTLKAPGRTKRFVKIALLIAAGFVAFVLISVVVLVLGFGIHPASLFKG